MCSSSSLTVYLLICRYQRMRFSPVSTWRNLQRRGQWLQLHMRAGIHRRQLSNWYETLPILAGVPVGGKISVCLIWNCMKYRIIILIIIIKRLGEILLSYMANTSHTHARTHPVSMYFPSQHFMVLLVDDVVSSRRPITPDIHLLSLTIFTQ